MNTLALGPSWLDPDYLLNTFGLPGLLLIVFAESGLLIGFFLPGDSLLFTTGLLVTTGDLKYPLWLVCVLVALAAIIGDQVGYLFGRKVGPALFKRPDSRLFKQENVEKAHEFFEKYGPKSLVLARFVPIVRTFTPIIAGVSRMNYRSFITFNIIGGVLWGVGVTLLGAALGQIDFVHQNIEMILILIVLVSVVPIAIEFLRARSRSKKEGADGQEGRGPSDGAPGSGPRDGAGDGGQDSTAHRFRNEQAAPFGGGGYAADQYGQGGGYDTRDTALGAPQGGAPYGGAQDGRQAPYGGQYGQYPQQGQQAPYGQQGQAGGYGAAGQYGQQGQAGGYGAADQYGQQGQAGGYGAADQYGQQARQGQYGPADHHGQQGQAGHYGQQGQYGGQADQYGRQDQYGRPGEYGAVQGAPYGGAHDGGYGVAREGGYGDARQPGPYAEGADGQDEDPGRYGRQNGR
ncbi:DedA family protein [Streptomyces sp. NPDC059166]|uniref:DedA family protein n=1 Tax=Streptomyces sp. NPDC059166 TaxID=3346752 RepID=UPI003687D57F